MRWMVLVLLATASACGVSIDQACGDFANALCAKYDECQPDAGTLLRYGDFGTCFSRQKANCITSTNAPNTGRSPATTENCAKAYPGYSCSDFATDDPPAVCQTVMGTLAAGTACAFSAQCATAYCAVSRYGTCGTCSEPPDAGGDCTNFASCAYGQACVTNVTDGGVIVQATCQAYVGLNGACVPGIPCVPGTSCVGASRLRDGGLVNGTCMAEGNAAGAQCDSRDRTDAGCDGRFNLFCSPATEQCEVETVVPAGQACGYQADSGVDGICFAGAACELVDGGPSRACSGPAADGQACDTIQGPPCLPPAKCVTASGGPGAGTCTLVDGTSCH